MIVGKCRSRFSANQWRQSSFEVAEVSLEVVGIVEIGSADKGYMSFSRLVCDLVEGRVSSFLDDVFIEDWNELIEVGKFVIL